MSAVKEQISRAQRRLMLNVLLEWASRGAICGSIAWIGLLAMRRVLGLPIPPPYAALAALLTAAADTAAGVWRHRVSQLGAATTLDEAAGLKERLSTALAITGSRDAFALLAAQDAEQAAATVRVHACIRPRAPRNWHWSAATVAAAFLLTLFLPPLELLKRRSAPEPPQRQQALAEKHAVEQDLTNELRQLQKLAEGNPALQELVADLPPAQIPENTLVTPEDVRQEAARQIDNLRQRLESAREKIQPDAIRETERLLTRLQPEPGNDAASRTSRELSRGDLQAAADALKQLENQARQAAQTAGTQTSELNELRRKLSNLADQLAELSNDRYLEKELENKLRLSREDAEKLARQLCQMDPGEAAEELNRRLCESGLPQERIQEILKRFQQKIEARRCCGRIAKSLQQACDNLTACSKGDQAAAERAAADLARACGELSNLAEAKQLSQALEAQQEKLARMRQSVCQGGYCSAAGGGVGGKNAGRGSGAHVAQPGISNQTHPERVRLTPGRGQILGEIPGDLPEATRASAEMREVILTAQRAAIDAINRQHVPKQYEAAVRRYFDRLAGVLTSQPPESEKKEQTPPASEPSSSDATGSEQAP
jgi:hypothetical protein